MVDCVQMSENFDINQPVLLVVKRGRFGKGYLICAADDVTNPAPAANANEVGEMVVAMLDDPNQPRFDENSLSVEVEEEQQCSAPPQEEIEDEEEEEDEEEYGEEEDHYAGLDAGERLLFALGEKLVGKARSASNSYRKKKKK